MSTFTQAEEMLRMAADCYEETNTPAGRRMAMLLRYHADKTGVLAGNSADAIRACPYLSDERLSTERDNYTRDYTVRLRGVWALPVEVNCLLDDRVLMRDPELATNDAVAKCFALIGENRDRRSVMGDVGRATRDGWTVNGGPLRPNP